MLETKLLNTWALQTFQIQSVAGFAKNQTESQYASRARALIPPQAAPKRHSQRAWSIIVPRGSGRTSMAYHQKPGLPPAGHLLLGDYILSWGWASSPSMKFLDVWKDEQAEDAPGRGFWACRDGQWTTKTMYFPVHKELRLLSPKANRKGTLAWVWILSFPS